MGKAAGQGVRRLCLALLVSAAAFSGVPALMAEPAGDLHAVVSEYEALSGSGGGNTAWPDVSAAAAERRVKAYGALRERLAALPADALNEQDRLTRELLDDQLALLIEEARFDEARIPFNNGDGFFNTANYAAQTTVIRNEADARAWIARLKALPAYYDAQIANMRRGIKTGFTQPRPTVESVLQIVRIAAEQPVAESPLLKPLAAMPATIPAPVREALSAEAHAAVRDAVKPAQRALVTFVEKEYLPKARPALGASTLPDGKAYYAFAVRRSTTTTLTPDEVFALGEAEIARIRTEMEAAMRETGFQGDLKSFLEYLRTAPEFYVPDLQTYLEKASEIGKRVDYLLPQWFRTLPRLPWGIRVKPPEMEASSGGYNLGDPVAGISGAVVVSRNSYQGPLFSLPAWMIHEGVPGHHLQIALGQERLDLPEFRRRDDITAFVEGWALYAERLGGEMGLYRTPYERFGQLSFEMWRACRLVMDVGLHWKGWTAEQAESCLRDNTALPERVVRGETQRYISWPGQALAYKVGEIKIVELRKRAEAALGQDFDIREFHDLLLVDGPMPLSVVERRVDTWIQQKQGKAGRVSR